MPRVLVRRVPELQLPAVKGEGVVLVVPGLETTPTLRAKGCRVLVPRVLVRRVPERRVPELRGRQVAPMLLHVPVEARVPIPA